MKILFFQLPLSGSPRWSCRGTSPSGSGAFNSLSRDHRSCRLEICGDCEESFFQLPLSGSQSLRALCKREESVFLSTPSLGITSTKRATPSSCGRAFSFNSLSRDHLMSSPSCRSFCDRHQRFQLPLSGSQGLYAEALRLTQEFFKLCFQLPLSGSPIVTVTDYDAQGFWAFQLPLSGSLYDAGVMILFIDLLNFQLPLSGSHRIFRAFGTPPAPTFQLPLSGSRDHKMLVELHERQFAELTFNSLSRDHLGF